MISMVSSSPWAFFSLRSRTFRVTISTRHAKLELGRVGFNIDQIAAHADSFGQVNNGRNIRNRNTRDRLMDDGVDIQGAVVAEFDLGERTCYGTFTTAYPASTDKVGATRGTAVADQIGFCIGGGRQGAALGRLPVVYCLFPLPP